MPNPNEDSKTVLEHPDTTAIREHEITPLKQRVDKCYSSEKYEDFQTAVKKIAIEVIESGDGRTKIKAHAKESAKEYDTEMKQSKKAFWTPNVIAIFAAGGAIIAAVVAVIALFR